MAMLFAGMNVQTISNREQKRPETRGEKPDSEPA